MDKITQLLSTLDRMKAPGAEPLLQPDCSLHQAQDGARRSLFIGSLPDADRLQPPICVAYAQCFHARHLLVIVCLSRVLACQLEDWC